jgi:5-formyltetrahydrofolate cyclo-ligase
MNSSDLSKKALRQRFRQERMALTDKQHAIYQDLLLIRFQEMPWPSLQLVHAFTPMVERREPDPGPMLRWLAFRNPGLQVASPRADFQEGTMIHVLVNEETDYELNAQGIPEPLGDRPVNPEEIDLVFLPLLAFDENGYRVGYGRGFYDRFLAQCRPDCVRVGLSFFGPVEKIADTDTFDQPMHVCITPDQVYEF